MRKWVLLFVCTVFVLALPPRALGGSSADPNAEHVKTLRDWSVQYFDVQKARRDGFKEVSAMVPNMGHHFVDFSVKQFDPKRPNTLLYARDGAVYKLIGVEWSFPFRVNPGKVPFRGADINKVHPAACHYTDGSEYPEPAGKDACKKNNPATGAAFAIWHPDLYTLHAYIWSATGARIFKGTNPALARYGPPKDAGKTAQK